MSIQHLVFDKKTPVRHSSIKAMELYLISSTIITVSLNPWTWFESFKFRWFCSNLKSLLVVKCLDSSGIAVRHLVKSKELCYKFVVCIEKLWGSQAELFFKKKKSPWNCDGNLVNRTMINCIYKWPRSQTSNLGVLKAMKGKNIWQDFIMSQWRHRNNQFLSH